VSSLSAALRFAVLAVAFWLSGFAALVYQVGWQRILALHSGVGTYSIAVIVAAFMAGLGLGSLAGGAISGRVSPVGALRLFALAELSIAAIGAASPSLYYDLYPRSAWLLSSPLRAGALHFFALLLPTLLMGTSLPFLARGVVAHARTAPLRLGVLYGLNVLGASAGALAAPWWLLRWFGIDGALLAAAAANGAAALLAGALSLGRFATAAERVVTVLPDGQPVRRRLALWLCLYGASGFCALALELVWFRVMEVGVRGTSFTFGTLLSLYLLFNAAGSLSSAPLVRRVRDPLACFLLLQAVLLLSAGLPYLALDVGLWPDSAWYLEYWRSGEFALGQANDAETIRRLYLQFPALLFGAPTFVMGIAFPLLQRAVQDEARTSGRKVGLLQAANIAGCVCGSVAAGLLALDTLGTTGTLRALIAGGAAFPALGAALTRHRGAFLSLSALLLATSVCLPGQDRLWTRLHGAEPGRALVGEDKSGVAAFVPVDRRYRVLVGGRGHSWLPFGGVHTRLGAIPAIVHPAPVNVAVIGLGSGDTAWGAGCRAETRSIEVFEISGPLPRLLRGVWARERIAPLDPNDPARLSQLGSFLADTRVDVRVADGRSALLLGSKRYDLIEADALRPDMAYSGNLYSLEFFRECARRLQPGGIMCTWAPTRRVYRTFRRAFPHVLRVGDDVLLGSNDPLPVDLAAWTRRAETPAVLAYLGEGIVRLVLRDLSRSETAAPAGRRSHDLNRDLEPRDEYGVPEGSEAPPRRQRGPTGTH
jgi:SAM-dependent methyltransferase